MTYKHGGFFGKIISVLLLGAFLNFGFASEHALCAEKKLLPQPDYDKQVAAMKDIFADLYWNLWTQRGMNTRLRVHVVKAVNEYSGVTAWAGEKGYAKTEEKINQLFGEDLNGFFDDLKEQFQISFAKYALMYYMDLFEEVLEKINDPAIKAKIKENCDEFFNEVDVTRKGDLSEKTSGGIMSWIVTGHSIAVPVVTKLLKQTGVAAMTGALGAEIGAFLANPVVALGPMVIYGAYRVAKGAVNLENGPEDMSNRLYDPMLRNYLYAVPEKFWDTIEGSVREVFKNIYSDAMDTVIKADESSEMDSELKKLIEEYSQAKK